MAAWITHLRVAEQLLSRYAIPAREQFLLGSLAPDSGVPVGDAMTYVPPKDVSHFKRRDAGGHSSVRPEAFVAQYLARTPAAPEDAAFLLGYLTHLAVDRRWADDVLAREKERYAALYDADPGAFFRFVKRDWYDLDFLYLRAHPDFAPWLCYLALPDVTNRWIDLFPQDAFALQRKAMGSFYTDGAAHVRPRAMEVLTAPELDAFVDAAAAGVCADWGELISRTLTSAPSHPPDDT